MGIRTWHCSLEIHSIPVKVISVYETEVGFSLAVGSGEWGELLEGGRGEPDTGTGD